MKETDLLLSLPTSALAQKFWPSQKKASALTSTVKLGLKNTERPLTTRKGEENLRTFPVLPQINILCMCLSNRSNIRLKTGILQEMFLKHTHNEEAL